jgi:hypothetical protein
MLLCLKVNTDTASSVSLLLRHECSLNLFSAVLCRIASISRLNAYLDKRVYTKAKSVHAPSVYSHPRPNVRSIRIVRVLHSPVNGINFLLSDSDEKNCQHQCTMCIMKGGHGFSELGRHWNINWRT